MAKRNFWEQGNCRLVALYYTTDISQPFFKYRRRKNVPAFEKARTSRSADIEIWGNSRHSRCPDTRRFWEYPKPFITLLSPVWVEKVCLGSCRWSAVPALWLQGLNLQLFRKRRAACTFREAGASTTQHSKYDGKRKFQTLRYRDVRGRYVLRATAKP